MISLQETERRAQAVVSSRAVPLIVSGLVAVAAVLAAFVVRQGAVDKRERATDAAETLFTNMVDDTRSRIVLEQTKLVFLTKGAASWASTTDDPSVARLEMYMQSLPISDRLPALQWLGVATLMDGRFALSRASSPVGEPLDALIGMDLASDERMLGAAIRAGDTNMVHGAVYAGTNGDQVVLIAPITGHEGYYITAGFIGEVFLSPALAQDGVTAALMPPGQDFVVVRQGFEAPASLPAPTGRVELIEDGTRFAFSTSETVLGEDWTLSVVSGEDFLEIPGSSEHWAVLFGGLLLASALFGLLMTRQRAAERQAEVASELTRSNRRYLTGFDAAPIGMAEVDAAGHVLRANRTMGEQLGRGVVDLLDRPLNDFVHPDDADDRTTRFRYLVGGVDAATSGEVRYVTPEGEIVWLSESIAALDRVDDVDRTFLVQSFDTTARRAAEVRLQELAFNDPLTGLPNRTRLFDRLEAALGHSRSTDEPVALLFIDIDRFKVVNDSLGHGAGDEVIAIIGERLAAQVSDPHLVARFGGDEFIVMCPGVGEGEKLDEFASAIHASVNVPMDLDDAPVQVTVSIGVIVGYGATDTPESLLRDADAAMYRAKAAGRNTTERFESSMRSAAIDRLDLERSLRRAIERDEFTVHYQPVVDLDTNRVAGFEALLRWEHPDRGLLEPSAFLSVADEAGLLAEIDSMTLQRAWSQLDEWASRSDAAKSWHLAVNCSPRWIHDDGLKRLLPEVLSSSSLAPDRLWLEVTEHDLLSDADNAGTALDELHELGVNVALDDFGTGFSSLSYLSRFKVDRLKIDRSFIASLDRSDADEAIVAAVVDLASALGIPTVAEGTESKAQLDASRRLGADFAQGFALSRPMPADEVDRALSRLG